ncbi:hypothetical protein ACFVYT_39840 [Streptomyces sp. NPDC058290]|uniref:hypothetical protein n=1 Tax=Streptomyces sp. NPDC058290 TaxID=3346426 RepID=UPI0036EC6C51
MPTSQSTTPAPDQDGANATHPAAEFVRDHGPAEDWQPLDFELYLERFSTPGAGGQR